MTDSTAPPASPGGLLAALRACGATLAETAGVRGSLFAVELREEVERRKQVFALGALAFVLLHTSFLLATALVVVLFWDSHRVAALAAMTCTYGACAAAAVVVLQRRMAAWPSPFAATRGELLQDFAPLQTPR